MFIKRNDKEEIKEKESKLNKIGLFDFIKALTNKKEDLTLHPDFKRDYNPYIINRALSSNPQTIHFALYCTQRNFSKEEHFKFLYYILPPKFYKFTFNKKNVNNDREETIKENIQHYFKVSQEKANEIFDTLNEDERNEFENIFGGRNDRNKNKNKK